MYWIKRVCGWIIALVGYFVAYDVLLIIAALVRVVRAYMSSNDSFFEIVSWWGANVVFTLIVGVICYYVVPFIVKLSNKINYSEKGLRFKVVGFFGLGAAILNIAANYNKEGWSPLHAFFMIVFCGSMLWTAFARVTRAPVSSTMIDCKMPIFVSKHHNGDAYNQISAILKSANASEKYDVNCIHCSELLFNLLTDFDFRLHSFFLHKIDGLLSFAGNYFEILDESGLADFSSMFPCDSFPDSLYDHKIEQSDALYRIIKPMFVEKSSADMFTIADNVETYYIEQLSLQANEYEKATEQYYSFIDFILSHIPSQARKSLPVSLQKESGIDVVRKILGNEVSSADQIE